MVLTVSFVVSPETGLFVSVACGSHHKLDTSVGVSERHDFAVRDQRIRLLRHPRPPHPAPTSVTIAIRPSSGCGMAGILQLILLARKAKNFLAHDWTTQITLRRLVNSAFWRNRGARGSQAPSSRGASATSEPGIHSSNMSGGDFTPVMARSRATKPSRATKVLDRVAGARDDGGGDPVIARSKATKQSRLPLCRHSGAMSQHRTRNP
jgi:hypothetical protein